MIDKIDRTKGIGGSDAYQIAKGNWNELWHIKTKRKEPDDLTWKLPVQIGIATEKTNVAFLEHEIKEEIITDITLVQKEFVMSHLDGCTNNGVPIECKHTNSRSNMEIVAKNYYAQLQHYLWHWNQNSIDKKHDWKKIDHIILSVIFGNERFETTVIDSDVEYQKELMIKETAFWKYVETDKEPMGLEVLDAPRDIKLDGMVKIDMGSNKAWSKPAEQFINTYQSSKDHELSKKELKLIVPDDCREAIGGGVTMKRNKLGRLTATLTKAEESNE